MKGIFITVRTGSTRLPNKSILKINGKHTIEYLIERVKKSRLADEIILCTTSKPEDDILCRIAVKNNIKYFKGHETNKWERWLDTCKAYDIDFFVTADGDDLFYEGNLADICFTQYMSNPNPNLFLNGQGLYNDVYGISYNTLQKICNMENVSKIEPHNIVNFLKNSDVVVNKILDVPDLYKKKDIRMTLDYEEDFNFFKKIIKHFNGEKFGLPEIISYIEQNPSVKDINKHLEIAWKENQLN